MTAYTRAHCRCVVVQNFTYAQAAAKLACEQRWLADHISRLPHQKFGRRVSFCDCDLRLIQDLQAVLPATVESHLSPPADETASTTAVPPLMSIRPAQGRGRQRAIA